MPNSQEAVTRRAAGLCWLGTDLSARRLNLAENLQQNAHTASPCASPMPVPTPGVTSPFAIVDDGLCQLAAPGSCDPPAAIFGKKSCRSGNGQNNGTITPALQTQAPPLRRGFLYAGASVAGWRSWRRVGDLLLAPNHQCPAEKLTGYAVVWFSSFG